MECKYKYCTREAQKYRQYCTKHKHVVYKETHPYRYAWNSLRSNAARRKREWEERHGRTTARYNVELTFDEFKQFCYKTQILVGRGRSIDAYHIDRIDVNKGYSVDNIQVLTNGQNVRKYLNYDYMLDHGRYYTVNDNDNEQSEGCPF